MSVGRQISVCIFIASTCSTSLNFISFFLSIILHEEQNIWRPSLRNLVYSVQIPFRSQLFPSVPCSNKFEVMDYVSIFIHARSLLTIYLLVIYALSLLTIYLLVIYSRSLLIIYFLVIYARSLLTIYLLVIYARSLLTIYLLVIYARSLLTLC
jgi:hypothetical protein